MSVQELNREELMQLKQELLDNRLMANEERNASFGELEEADSIVSDTEVFEEYGGYYFVKEDFWCNM